MCLNFKWAVILFVTMSLIVGTHFLLASAIIYIYIYIYIDIDIDIDRWD